MTAEHVPAASNRPASPEAIDEFLHTPARLAIMSLLAPAEWVRFSFLKETIGTSDSALSKQVSALEAVGYVTTRKDLSMATRRSTSVRITDDGRAAFDRYLSALEALLARARGLG